MSRIAINAFLLVLALFWSQDENVNFYYYHGNKMHINVNNDMAFIIYDEDDANKKQLFTPELISKKYSWEIGETKKYSAVIYPSRYVSSLIDDSAIK